MIYPGTQFGPYYIDRELGRGGMAIVYHAVDERNGAEIALKILSPNHAHNPVLVRRFRQEAENALRMRHPNIVRAFESGEIEKTPYIALNFATQGTLSNLLKQRKEPLPLDEAVQILRRIALALDYAHSRNVLHRDVKPSNILIGPSGQFWLSDFGVAKRMDSDYTLLTVASQTVGTPAYMSPEQARNDAEIDGRSDIYSLGVIAYTMLCGGMPFEAETQLSLLRKIIDDPPASPRKHNSKLTQGTCFVLERVLAKNPSARYPTAAEFVDALAESSQFRPNQLDWEKMRKESVAPTVENYESTSVYLPEFEPKGHSPGRVSRFLEPLSTPLGLSLTFIGIIIFIIAAIVLFPATTAYTPTWTPIEVTVTPEAVTASP